MKERLKGMDDLNEVKDMVGDIPQGEFWVVSNKQSLDAFVSHITKLYEDKKYVTIKWKAGKTRTSAQNNALHVYCRLLGEALNDAGYDMKKTVKASVDIPWTTDLVKQYLWKPIQAVVTGDDSTSIASREDYDKVHAVLSRHLSEKFNVYVPFPTK
jgi:hypothetical protein